MLRIGNFGSFWVKDSQETTLYRQKNSLLEATCPREVKYYIYQIGKALATTRVSSRHLLKNDLAKALNDLIVEAYSYNAELLSKTTQALKQNKEPQQDSQISAGLLN